MQGCYDEVWTYLEQYINIVVGCAGGLAGLEVLLFLSILKTLVKNKSFDIFTIFFGGGGGTKFGNALKIPK